MIQILHIIYSYEQTSYRASQEKRKEASPITCRYIDGVHSLNNSRFGIVMIVSTPLSLK
jgi:hypothetical protein